jgi:hypothetical protein
MRRCREVVVTDHTVGDFTWVVLADPDGNEFCLTPGH